MRNFLSLITVILTGMLLLACDNPVTVQEIHVTDTVKVSDTVKVPDTIPTIPTLKALTCLDAVTGAIPKGTMAKLTKSLQTTKVDSNGCFSFSTPKVAGRMLEGNDSVIFYNDSALFSVTIPYLNNGDTIQVVPTLVSLQKVPNVEIDSAFLVVYDRAHPQIQRKVKLKRTNYGTSSDYARTLWSVDGSIFQVHFAVTNKAKVNLASSVIESEAGGMVFRLYSDISKTYGPKLVGIRDTIFFHTGIDTVFHLPKYQGFYGVGLFTTSAKVNAESIYGISKILVDGVETDSITPLVNSFKEYTLTLVDSAGYVTNRKLMAYSAEKVSAVVSYSDRYTQWDLTGFSSSDSLSWHTLVFKDSL